MQTAIIGLGRIGKNICLHLLEQGVSVVAYNRSADDVDEVVKAGAVGAYALPEIIAKWGTTRPVIALLYVPAGAVVDEVIFGSSLSSPAQVARISENKKLDSSTLADGNDTVSRNGKSLLSLLPQDSIIIDGGNSFFKDSQKRYELVKQKCLHFLDMGTSGGIEGARNGACLMVGGDKEIYVQVEPLLSKIATTDGFGYVGPSGAGHFVKMIHNAVEYGMMGAIGEGINLVRSWQLAVGSGGEFQIDLAKIAKIWAHGSIVSGLLMNKTSAALKKDPQLDSLRGEVPKGETESEMEWLETLGLPMPVISASRNERVETRTKPSFTGKVIAALRREFGGHAVKSVERSKKQGVKNRD